MELGHSSRLQLLQPEMAGQLLANPVVMHMHLPTTGLSCVCNLVAIAEGCDKSLLRCCYEH